MNFNYEKYAFLALNIPNDFHYNFSNPRPNGVIKWKFQHSAHTPAKKKKLQSAKVLSKNKNHLRKMPLIGFFF